MLLSTRFHLPVAPIEYGADRINRSTLLAFAAHHGRTRKDGRTPQILHPLAVQGLLARVGFEDDALLSAAILHDALEDNPGDAAQVLRLQIGHSLGSQVLAWVDALTDDAPAHLSRAERKARQLERLQSAPPEVQLIKLADVVASVQEGPAPGWTPAEARQYLQQRTHLVQSLLRRHCAELGFYFQHALTQPAWRLAHVAPDEASASPTRPHAGNSGNGGNANGV